MCVKTRETDPQWCLPLSFVMFTIVRLSDYDFAAVIAIDNDVASSGKRL